VILNPEDLFGIASKSATTGGAARIRRIKVNEVTAASISDYILEVPRLQLGSPQRTCGRQGQFSGKQLFGRPLAERNVELAESIDPVQPIPRKPD